MTKTKEQIEAEMFEAVMLPIIKKHGVNKGSRIVAAVGDILGRMVQWPDDIKNECNEEFERILKMAKAESEIK